tara:strand:- start:174 stop:593 length:420 start_codon:yes stop_codon:yes gene_type:complete
VDTDNPTKFFVIEEFVDEPTLQAYGEKLCWGFLDHRILRAADKLRRDFGPLICNTWLFGQDRTESGLRVPGMLYYREGSQHAHGRALDLVPMDTTADEMRYAIRHDRKRYKDITGIEEGVPWCHIDCRYPERKLQEFSK